MTPELAAVAAAGFERVAVARAGTRKGAFVLLQPKPIPAEGERQWDAVFRVDGVESAAETSDLLSDDLARTLSDAELAFVDLARTPGAIAELFPGRVDAGQAAIRAAHVGDRVEILPGPTAFSLLRAGLLLVLGGLLGTFGGGYAASQSSGSLAALAMIVALLSFGAFCVGIYLVRIGAVAQLWRERARGYVTVDDPTRFDFSDPRFPHVAARAGLHGRELVLVEPRTRTVLRESGGAEVPRGELRRRAAAARRAARQSRRNTHLRA